MHRPRFLPPAVARPAGLEAMMQRRDRRPCSVSARRWLFDNPSSRRRDVAEVP